MRDESQLETVFCGKIHRWGFHSHLRIEEAVAASRGADDVTILNHGESQSGLSQLPAR